MAFEISRLIFPKKFSNRFPTKLETLRAFLYEKQNYSKENLSRKEPSNSVIADAVVKQIQKIYANAGVKTLVRKDIIAGKVMKAYESRLELLKFSRCQRYTKSFLKKKEQFESVMGEMLQVTDTKKIKQKQNLKKKSNEIPENDLSVDHEIDLLHTDDEKDPDYEPLSDSTASQKAPEIRI